VLTVLGDFTACIQYLDLKAVGVYKSLEPFVAPDSIVPGVNNAAGNPSAVLTPISDFLKTEAIMSAKISAISAAISKPNAADAPAIAQLTAQQKFGDAIAADLAGYSQRITDLANFDNGNVDCSQVGSGIAGKCVWVVSQPDDSTIYREMVTRAITYSLGSLNLVSTSQEGTPDPTKKRALAAIVINFADTQTTSPGAPFTLFRLEASAGVFFSTLPIRTYSVAPVFAGGMVSDNLVSEDVLHPTVVPFAAANYRLSNDLAWTRWKSDFYWTAAVGVNPNTVSADFATGPSISWRGLMISALCHFGHETVLTQGFASGQHLGAAFTETVPTRTRWTTAFALGLSVRVPALTGR
jgi:hypothetical protein